ncbi:hypothetical protein VP01_3045g1 [Puccinia sorghi]|uniref:Uncharacterized protein n=1 Tax=Puccinia sorghi TaxID=27349 RepID=A0A0L6V1R6_9BASI|nr:hypothetical protein VP01_3045g1 [Puccinia sorghi]
MLQTHKQETLSTLPISLDKKELFDLIKCSSDTKIISKRVPFSIPLNWWSTLFTKLATQLNQTLVVNTPFENVPFNLPISCYFPNYLSNLSDQQKDFVCQLSIYPIWCQLLQSSQFFYSSTFYILRLQSLTIFFLF